VYRTTRKLDAEYLTIRVQVFLRQPTTSRTMLANHHFTSHQSIISLSIAHPHARAAHLDTSLVHSFKNQTGSMVQPKKP
jgi:hypothetical protein